MLRLKQRQDEAWLKMCLLDVFVPSCSHMRFKHNVTSCFVLVFKLLIFQITNNTSFHLFIFIVFNIAYLFCEDPKLLFLLLALFKMKSKRVLCPMMINTKGSQLHVDDHGALSKQRMALNEGFTSKKFEASCPFYVQENYKGFSKVLI